MSSLKPSSEFRPVACSTHRWLNSQLHPLNLPPNPRSFPPTLTHTQLPLKLKKSALFISFRPSVFKYHFEAKTWSRCPGSLYIHTGQVDLALLSDFLKFRRIRRRYPSRCVLLAIHLRIRQPTPVQPEAKGEALALELSFRRGFLSERAGSTNPPYLSADRLRCV